MTLIIVILLLLGYVVIATGHLTGVNKDETVACGDGENDIPMLQEVTHAVVMKNAMAKVRKYGKYTAGNCYDEGLAEWIERNLL